jgi:hypothetical protein
MRIPPLKQLLHAALLDNAQLSYFKGNKIGTGSYFGEDSATKAIPACSTA